MASKYTTHQLATMLEEVSNALRELPDIPLSDFQPPRPAKAQSDTKVIEVAESLPQPSKEETIQLLNNQSQKNLTQICRHLKINIGSNKTKSNLIDQLVWHFYTAVDELYVKHTKMSGLKITRIRSLLMNRSLEPDI